MSSSLALSPLLPDASALPDFDAEGYRSVLELLKDVAALGVVPRPLSSSQATSESHDTSSTDPQTTARYAKKRSAETKAIVYSGEARLFGLVHDTDAIAHIVDATGNLDRKIQGLRETGFFSDGHFEFHEPSNLLLMNVELHQSMDKLQSWVLLLDELGVRLYIEAVEAADARRVVASAAGPWATLLGRDVSWVEWVKKIQDHGGFAPDHGGFAPFYEVWAIRPDYLGAPVGQRRILPLPLPDNPHEAGFFTIEKTGQLISPAGTPLPPLPHNNTRPFGHNLYPPAIVVRALVSISFSSLPEIISMFPLIVPLLTLHLRLFRLIFSTPSLKAATAAPASNDAHAADIALADLPLANSPLAPSLAPSSSAVEAVPSSASRRCSRSSNNTAASAHDEVPLTAARSTTSISSSRAGRPPSSDSSADRSPLPRLPLTENGVRAVPSAGVGKRLREWLEEVAPPSKCIPMKRAPGYAHSDDSSLECTSESDEEEGVVDATERWLTEVDQRHEILQALLMNPSVDLGYRLHLPRKLFFPSLVAPRGLFGPPREQPPLLLSSTSQWDVAEEILPHGRTVRKPAPIAEPARPQTGEA
ncbi:hypothetical protein JCM10450v2_000103 [Rhodotorula kratochvilovae]